MSLKFKLVDLTDQIRTAVAAAPAEGSETVGMHIRVSDGKVDVVPLQTGPSDPSTGGYGDTTWGPCPQDLRSDNYHDPVQPGAVIQGDGGAADLYVWVAEQGYVAMAQAPTGTASALKTLTDAALAFAKTSTGS